MSMAMKIIYTSTDMKDLDRHEGGLEPAGQAGPALPQQNESPWFRGSQRPGRRPQGRRAKAYYMLSIKTYNLI